MTRDDALRAVAVAADNGGRSWEWKGGYPQQVIRIGDVMLVAETYEGPDFPSTIAEFIATFDPPTVLALLDEVARLRALLVDARPGDEGEAVEEFRVGVHDSAGPYTWIDCTSGAYAFKRAEEMATQNPDRIVWIATRVVTDWTTDIRAARAVGEEDV